MIGRRFGGQLGQALPMVLGALLVFGISTVTVTVYATSSQKGSDQLTKRDAAGDAAEAALNTAIDVLGSSSDPTLTTDLPSCTTPYSLVSPPPGTTATYCGSLSGMTWTITARGTATTGTSATVGQVRPKVITQTATIEPFWAGGLGAAWDRIMQDDASKCATFNKDVITVPVVVAGCVTMTGDATHPTILEGPTSIGGNVTMQVADSIGTSGTPITEADIGGTCTYNKHPAHTPCTSADNVFANTIGTVANPLPRPTMDFNYWYTNAAPGPMNPCTVGSLPTGYKFDKNTTYNRDAPVMQLTPSGVDYTCQVWSIPPSSGTLLGELSWDSVNQILTVHGNVFFDGDVKATAPGHSKACAKPDHGPFCDTTFSYVGRGAIFASGKLDIEAGLCSGGDGSNDCENDVSSWDPTQNLLVFVTGGLKNTGDDTFTMLKDQAVYQGAVWSVGKCRINVKANVSAPLLCGQLSIKETDTDDPSVNPWPASLVAPSNGQLYPNPGGDWSPILGPEYGD